MEKFKSTKRRESRAEQRAHGNKNCLGKREIWQQCAGASGDRTERGKSQWDELVDPGSDSGLVGQLDIHKTCYVQLARPIGHSQPMDSKSHSVVTPNMPWTQAHIHITYP
ncbi:hypothetical protein CBL_05424 [Carabus blaptoides fortunei]